ncbi:hypothetical protein [Aquirufa aurantiipilula]|uniref:hypothetical protein n=1 Tax=Aquirufa aurantiipilula TaxID=2696561 RepID=UPI001CAA4EEF|nr:hypothetical protein [Aquirufa aurantiipilula]MBZ1326541.1 hypothetical protein [Aquirufa aurantiipilula]
MFRHPVVLSKILAIEVIIKGPFITPELVLGILGIIIKGVFFLSFEVLKHAVLIHKYSFRYSASNVSLF